MAVLSIQSHVVYGYAGNTAAVFPMQRLGREVWAVNTVEFSNHTGYGAWRGTVLGGELAGELVTGLEERGVLSRCEAVLSGYLGDASVARAITGAVQRVKAASPKALYCCDPVMGDVGRGFYVKPDIPGMFKNELVPLADIITPNQFELEALTGLDTQNIDDARRAIDMIHSRGPGIVLVTSYYDGKNSGGRQIGMLVSDKSGIYSITTPELPIGAGMAGSGDITASVFLSRYLETGDVKKTLELCTASIFGILELSLRACIDTGVPNNMHGDKPCPLKECGTARAPTNTAVCNTGGLALASPAGDGDQKAPPMELKIIQAQNELDSPSHYFEARRL